MISGSPVPESLIKRGIAVPFTSRLLRHARIRQGKNGPFFLLPDLGDGRGHYMLPGDELPKLGGMTVFDNAVFASLTENRIITPFRVNKQAAEIAKTGLGGAQFMQQCRTYLQDLQQETNSLTLTLIQKAVAQLSDANDAARQLDRSSLAKPDGIQAASKALGGFAKKAKLSSEELFQILDEWTALLVPLGIGEEPYNFSVKATLQDMNQVSVDLKQWLISEPVGPAELAQRTALAMQYTAELGRSWMKQQNAMIDSMDETLSDWDGKRAEVSDISDSLQYLVSGWKPMLDQWHNRENRERFSQRELLQECAPFLPLLPDDLTGKHGEFWTDLRRLQPKWAGKTQLVQLMDHAVIGGLERFRRAAA